MLWGCMFFCQTGVSTASPDDVVNARRGQTFFEHRLHTPGGAVDLAEDRSGLDAADLEPALNGSPDRSDELDGVDLATLQNECVSGRVFYHFEVAHVELDGL